MVGIVDRCGDRVRADGAACGGGGGVGDRDAVAGEQAGDDTAEGGVGCAVNAGGGVGGDGVMADVAGGHGGGAEDELVGEGCGAVALGQCFEGGGEGGIGLAVCAA